MVLVSKVQAEAVEYLLAQSFGGHHFLFDSESIRDAFVRPVPAQSLDGIEAELEAILSQPSLNRKRAYFESLDLATQQRVIQIYFNILDNTLFERGETRH